MSGSVTLGASGVTLPGLGVGCMGLTEFYGKDSAAADVDGVIGRAIDLGLGFFDTADAYGPWRNEETVGRALQGRRDKVILATKFGVRRNAGNTAGLTGLVCGKADYVREACDASLQRLQTDYIDIYYMHRPDPMTPIEETAEAMGALVRAGKVRAIGFSEIGPGLLRRAHAVHPVGALQSEYSLWHRDPDDILDDLRDLGVALVPYSPLGRGFLTGTIRSIDDLAPDDWRRNSPRFQGENFARNLAIVDELKIIAKSKGCTLAQLALAWLRTRAPFVVPICGPTTIAQLEENASALAVRLTENECEAIEHVSPLTAFSGHSWPAGSVGAAVDRTR